MRWGRGVFSRFSIGGRSLAWALSAARLPLAGALVLVLVSLAPVAGPHPGAQAVFSCSPPWTVPPGDDDCDGFTTKVEDFMGTRPSLACSTDNWPADMAPAVADHVVNIIDIGAMRTVFASVPGDGRYVARKDLNGDSKINIVDIGVIRPFFNKTCTPGVPPIPIDHILVLMQENRSFDHYFGQLRAFDPTLDVEAEPPGASNPDPTNPGGPAIPAFHQTRLCDVADVTHSWSATHRQMNNGAMDGFTTENVHALDPTGSRAMGYYNQNELPYYYTLYSTFAMSDRFFSSLPGPTYPNREYLVAGTSFGHIRNDQPVVSTEFAQPSLFNLLDDAGISWKIYYSQVTLNDVFAFVRNHPLGNKVLISQYFTDAANGTLPQVAFIDPIFAAQKNLENDEHPPANVQVGQKFVADVISALMASPNWGSSALFLTYDEHGGYYDHVPPPPAPLPDGIAPMLQAGDEPGAFDRYGIRVPTMVVSPYAKSHFVSHTIHDHTSILRFIETRFNLPALSNRDANTDPMLEFFNFQSPPFATPPALPAATVDLSRPECAD